MPVSDIRHQLLSQTSELAAKVSDRGRLPGAVYCRSTVHHQLVNVPSLSADDRKINEHAATTARRPRMPQLVAECGLRQVQAAQGDETAPQWRIEGQGPLGPSRSCQIMHRN